MHSVFAKFVVATAILAVGAMTGRAAEYTLDSSHAAAVFNVNHLGFSKTYGAFTDISGSFSFDPSAPEKATATVTVKTDSINTFHEGRDKHLKNEDFFNVEKFPEITFKTSNWKKTGDNTFDVTGDFTMLGVTQEITIPVHFHGAGDGMKGEKRSGFSTAFSIKRSDYGMTKMVGPIGDDVNIEISFEGVQN